MCQRENIISLSYFYSNPWEGFAGEVVLFGLDEGDDTIFGGVDGEIARHISTLASELRSASLADENFAGFNLLATKALDAQALAGIVVDIFGGTASFHM